jgi:hypothetical protein
MRTLPPSPTSKTIVEQLNEIGVPCRSVYSPCHWNVAPVSSFKPWTDEQVEKLEQFAADNGLTIICELVNYVGGYFELLPPRERNKGVRLS